MLFTRTFIVSALAALASAQSTLNSAQEAKAASDLGSYLIAIKTEPGYSAANAVFATAVPSDVLAQIVNDPAGWINSVYTATAQPTWYAALPTSVRAFYSSVGAAEYSIINKDAKAPAPTSTNAAEVANAVKVGGAVLAAGGAVLALL